MIERRTFVWHGVDHPAFEARGPRDGPKLSLIAGIHGCEYSSIAAVLRFMNELDTSELSGTITAVPVVSMESFRQRSAFVVPGACHSAGMSAASAVMRSRCSPVNCQGVARTKRSYSSWSWRSWCKASSQRFSRVAATSRFPGSTAW